MQGPATHRAGLPLHLDHKLQRHGGWQGGRKPTFPPPAMQARRMKIVALREACYVGLNSLLQAKSLTWK